MPEIQRELQECPRLPATSPPAPPLRRTTQPNDASSVCPRPLLLRFAFFQLEIRDSGDLAEQQRDHPDCRARVPCIHSPPLSTVTGIVWCDCGLASLRRTSGTRRSRACWRPKCSRTASGCAPLDNRQPGDAGGEGTGAGGIASRGPVTEGSRVTQAKDANNLFPRTQTGG